MRLNYEKLISAKLFERNILKQVKVARDGEACLTIRGLANLAGIDQSNLTKKINNLGEVEKVHIALQNSGLGEVFLIDDFCFDTKYITTKYKYKLTDYGREMGYTQNINGTVFDPK